MKKFGAKGTKWVKVVHLVLVVLMLGGIISSLVIRLGLSTKTYEETLVVYMVLLAISDHVIRYGGIGLLLIGFVYGIWTSWGFFKHRWIAVKWVVFIGQTVFGIAFIDRWMVQNYALLETEQAAALGNPVFQHNESLILYGAMSQVGLLVMLTIISVWKPWKKKSV